MTDTVRVPRASLYDLLDAANSFCEDGDLLAGEIRNRVKAMLAASPQGEGSSADPAPIKPSADTGELRERVAQIIEAAIERHNPGNSLRHTVDDADAILDLIQSERGSSPIGQNDQPGLAFSDAGEP